MISINGTPIKKVLFIKLCCIGDIIQATPAMRAVSESGAEAHFLCSKWVSGLIDMVPYISKKFETTGTLSLLEIALKLRAEKYDLIINFHRDMKAYLFTALLGAKQRAGFNWKGQGLFLTRPFPFDAKAHEGKRYSSVTSGLGFGSKGDETLIKAPSPEAKKTGLIRIGFFPGGGKNPGTVMTTKRWPIERFSSLAAALKKKGAEVCVFGGAIDSDVTGQMRVKNEGLKFIETKDLKELADRISGMDLFIAGDTGPLHMSAALGVRTIGLFGPSSPELVGPPGKHVINLWDPGECAPCYLPETVNKREFLSCRDNICMKKITVDMVLKAVEELLHRDP